MGEQLTPEAVERLKALAKAATPRPWIHRQGGVTSRDGHREYDWIADRSENHTKIIAGRDSFYGGSHDYAFVVAAVNALPALLSRIHADAERIQVLERAGNCLLKELEWVNDQLDLMPDDYAEAQKNLRRALKPSQERPA